MFDPTLKILVDDFESSLLPFILNRVGLAATIRAVAIDSNFPSTSLEADRVYRLSTNPPSFLHIEFESSRPSGGRPERFLKYNVLVSDREGLTTRTVVILLRPEAQSSDLTGELIRHFPGKPESLIFRYDVIRLWEIPAQAFLEAGPWLCPSLHWVM